MHADRMPYNSAAIWYSNYETEILLSCRFKTTQDFLLPLTNVYMLTYKID